MCTLALAETVSEPCHCELAALVDMSSASTL